MANLIRREAGTPSLFEGRWDPFRVMREMLRWDPFVEALPTEIEPTFVPRFEVKEAKEAYIFKADLPGVEEKDLDISLTGNRLTVNGKREAEKRTEEERYYAYERTYGSFTRSFTLPDGADAEHVKAELKNGVLTLVVPKVPEHQPKKIALRGEGGKAIKA
jgi:HSP20 family protein